MHGNGTVKSRRLPDVPYNHNCQPYIVGLYYEDLWGVDV
jgi:hypothetical protein